MSPWPTVHVCAVKKQQAIGNMYTDSVSLTGRGKVCEKCCGTERCVAASGPRPMYTFCCSGWWSPSEESNAGMLTYISSSKWQYHLHTTIDRSLKVLSTDFHDQQKYSPIHALPTPLCVVLCKLHTTFAAELAPMMPRRTISMDHTETC